MYIYMLNPDNSLKILYLLNYLTILTVISDILLFMLSKNTFSTLEFCHTCHQNCIIYIKCTSTLQFVTKVTNLFLKLTITWISLNTIPISNNLKDRALCMAIQDCQIFRSGNNNLYTFVSYYKCMYINIYV